MEERERPRRERERQADIYRQYVKIEEEKVCTVKVQP